MAELYKQCSMTRRVGETVHRRTEWIPVKYAVVGNPLKLRNDGVWEDGWIVDTANGEAQEPPRPVVLPSIEPKKRSGR
jgi:hypothetical protein